MIQLLDSYYILKRNAYTCAPKDKYMKVHEGTQKHYSLIAQDYKYPKQPSTLNGKLYLIHPIGQLYNN